MVYSITSLESGKEISMIHLLDKGFIEIVSSMGTDSSVVNAARVSFNNDQSAVDTERDIKLIKYLLINGHTSPFEHVTFTFHVKCPLFIRSQWMRHRTWSFSEISRRYTSEDIDFYIPTSLRVQDENDRQASKEEFLEEIFPGESVEKSLTIMSEHALQNYYWMLDIGVAREQARMILPQNMYTRFYATVDLHNLLHFIKLRSSSHAQYEIRCYSDAILSLIEEYVPLTIKAWRDVNGNF